MTGPTRLYDQDFASGALIQVTKVSGAVPNTITITAGSGLTGGGDLSANRTISVIYGTGSNTVCQGDDSRLSAIGGLTAHVLAGPTGLGPYHTVSSLSSGQFLRASGATQAYFGLIATGDLPSGINASYIGNGAVSNTSFQYLSGVTSNIQSQLLDRPLYTEVIPADDIRMYDQRNPYPHVFASSSGLNSVHTVIGLTSGSFLKASGANNMTVAVIIPSELPTGIDATYIGDGSVNNTEWGYLGTVTSNVQTQLNTKTATGHTHSWVDLVSGVPTTLAGYGITNAVSTGISVLAGSGLTGGGDLSASRTLSNVYGTDSNTVCQGNDSRLAINTEDLLLMSTTSSISWTSMPAAETPAFGSDACCVVADLSRASSGRIIANLNATGFTGAKLYLKAATGFGPTTARLEISGITGDLAIGTAASSGIRIGAWFPLDPTYKISDCVVRPVGSGGNGAISPSFKNLHIQFK